MENFVDKLKNQIADQILAQEKKQAKVKLARIKELEKVLAELKAS